MRPVVRALYTELSSPAGLVVGLLSVAVAVAAGLLRTPPLNGPTWSAAFNEALTGLIGLAPLCAGAVAWLVQDYHRRGIAALAASSPRGAAGGALPRVCAVMLYTLLGYLVLLATAAVRTSHRGLPGWPSLLLVLLAASFLVLSMALGWAVGAVVTLRVAPPLLAIALLAAVYAGSYGEDWVGRLVPVDRMTATDRSCSRTSNWSRPRSRCSPRWPRWPCACRWPAGWPGGGPASRPWSCSPVPCSC